LLPKNRTWAEINLDNLLHNFAEFRRVAPSSKIMCAIKADAYGHGAVTVARVLEAAGADYFAVTALDEALELRAAGITAPVLVLTHILYRRVPEAIENNITLTVFSTEMAKAISLAAVSLGAIVKIHIKIDTGMTRVGFNVDEAVPAIHRIAAMPGVEIEGVFTHYASADETDPAYTLMQLARYNEIIAQLSFPIKIRHTANSAAAIMFPETRLDMIRPGISLFGCYPSEEVDKRVIDLRPCLSLKSQIVRVNDVPPGVPISYGRIFTTSRFSKIATIPVGYADGYSRLLTGKARAALKVDGKIFYAPVVGKICMDQCMIDITDAPGADSSGSGVKLGDEVVLFGDGLIPIEEVAREMGTVNYEVMCMLSRRVPRFYIRNGKIESTENYLI